MTAEQIAAELDFLGAELSSECTGDASYLTLRCLERDLSRLLPLFLKVLSAPAFDSSEVEICRRDILASIRLREDRPGPVSEEALDRALYGDHPYGHPVDGSTESVRRISASDISAFYRSHYSPDGIVIAAVGPFRPPELLSRVRRLTRGWKPSPVPPGGVPPAGLPWPRRGVLVHRPVSQAYINIGFFSPSRGDPDYQAARLMNYILGGGGFSSRLTKSVRVRHGLAYDVDAGYDPRLGPGPYRISVQTKTASADTALRLLVAGMREMMALEVEPGELQEAKDNILGSYPFRFETAGQTAAQFLMLELNRLPDDYFERDLRLTAGATPGEVRRAALRLLKPDSFALGVVGDTLRLRLEVPDMVLDKE